MELAVPLASREAREVAGDCLLGFFFLLLASCGRCVCAVCALAQDSEAVTNAPFGYLPLFPFRTGISTWPIFPLVASLCQHGDLSDFLIPPN